MPAANTRRAFVIALVGVLAAVIGVAVYALKSKDTITGILKTPPRPAAGTPRGVMWDVWHAAMNDDRDGVRAAMLATNDVERGAADALAELLVAEARFARQLQHTWPMSPTSRDGAGTWFGEGADAGLLTARENIDAAAINATVNMNGTPVKLTRSGGAWKIVTANLVRAHLKRGNGNANADVDLVVASQRLAAMTKAYRDLTREVAALRIASPSAAIEELRESLAAAATTAATAQP